MFIAFVGSSIRHWKQQRGISVSIVLISSASWNLFSWRAVKVPLKKIGIILTRLDEALSCCVSSASARHFVSHCSTNFCGSSCSLKLRESLARTFVHLPSPWNFVGHCGTSFCASFCSVKLRESLRQELLWVFLFRETSWVTAARTFVHLPVPWIFMSHCCTNFCGFSCFVKLRESLRQELLWVFLFRRTSWVTAARTFVHLPVPWIFMSHCGTNFCGSSYSVKVRESPRHELLCIFLFHESSWVTAARTSVDLPVPWNFVSHCGTYFCGPSCSVKLRESLWHVLLWTFLLRGTSWIENFCEPSCSVKLHEGFDESPPYWCLIHLPSFWEPVDNLLAPFYGHLWLSQHLEKLNDARFWGHPDDASCLSLKCLNHSEPS
jgi:hypothetical protein